MLKKVLIRTSCDGFLGVNSSSFRFMQTCSAFGRAVTMRVYDRAYSNLDRVRQT